MAWLKWMKKIVLNPMVRQLAPVAKFANQARQIISSPRTLDRLVHSAGLAHIGKLCYQIGDVPFAVYILAAWLICRKLQTGSLSVPLRVARWIFLSAINCAVAVVFMEEQASRLNATHRDLLVWAASLVLAALMGFTEMLTHLTARPRIVIRNETVRLINAGEKWISFYLPERATVTIVVQAITGFTNRQFEASIAGEDLKDRAPLDTRGPMASVRVELDQVSGSSFSSGFYLYVEW